MTFSSRGYLNLRNRLRRLSRYEMNKYLVLFCWTYVGASFTCMNLRAQHRDLIIMKMCYDSIKNNINI